MIDGGADALADLWIARHNETGEQVMIRADDVAWVLAHPLLTLVSTRGYYSERWIIKGVGLEMRLIPEGDES